MAIDQRGDHAAIEKSGKATGIFRVRGIAADAFLSLPVALEMVSVCIQPPAAIAVGIVIGILILKRLFAHRSLLHAVCANVAAGYLARSLVQGSSASGTYS